MEETLARSICPECPSGKVVKNGRRKNRQPYLQRYLCRNCGKRSQDSQFMSHHRFPIEVIRTVVTMVYSGISYRETGRCVPVMYDLCETNISTQTIHQWVKRYMDAAVTEIRDRQSLAMNHWMLCLVVMPGTGPKWWIVLDRATCAVLASHLCVTGGREDVRGVIDQAIASWGGSQAGVASCVFRTFGVNNVSPRFKDLVSQMIRSELPEATRGSAQQETNLLLKGMQE